VARAGRPPLPLGTEYRPDDVARRTQALTARAPCRRNTTRTLLASQEVCGWGRVFVWLRVCTSGLLHTQAIQCFLKPASNVESSARKSKWFAPYSV